jgi:hypothetical protein
MYSPRHHNWNHFDSSFANSSESDLEATPPSPAALPPPFPVFRRNDPYAFGPFAALTLPPGCEAKTIGNDFTGGLYVSSAPSWQGTQLQGHGPRFGYYCGSPRTIQSPIIAPTSKSVKGNLGNKSRNAKDSGSPTAIYRAGGNASPSATTVAQAGNWKWFDTQSLMRGRSICQHLQYPPLFPVAEADLDRQVEFLQQLPPYLLETFLRHNTFAGTADPVLVGSKHQQPAMAHRYLMAYLPFLPYPSFSRDGGAPLHIEYPPLDSYSGGSWFFIPTLEELVSSLSEDHRPSLTPVDFGASGELDPQLSQLGELRCRFHRRLFVGNIKKDLPLRFLQWLLELVSSPSTTASQEKEASSEAPTMNPAYLYDASIHRHSNATFKGCVHVTLATNEDPEIHRNLIHRRVLFDHTGAWFATTQAEERLLLTYCTAIAQIPDTSLLKTCIGNLPRSPMSWETAENRENARCARGADTQDAFVRQLLDSRTGLSHSGHGNAPKRERIVL